MSNTFTAARSIDVRQQLARDVRKTGRGGILSPVICCALQAPVVQHPSPHAVTCGEGHYFHFGTMRSASVS